MSSMSPLANAAAPVVPAGMIFFATRICRGASRAETPLVHVVDVQQDQPGAEGGDQDGGDEQDSAASHSASPSLFGSAARSRRVVWA